MLSCISLCPAAVTMDFITQNCLSEAIYFLARSTKHHVKPNCEPLSTLRGDLFQKVNSLKVPFSPLLDLSADQTPHMQRKQANSPESIANKKLNQITELNTTYRTRGILSLCSQHHSLGSRPSRTMECNVLGMFDLSKLWG